MKILVVQIGRFGDMILTTPLLLGIRDLYPQAEIHVLASHRNYEVLQGLDCVDVIHVYKKNPVEVFKVVSDLRSLNFDLLLDPKDHSSKESSMIAKLVNAATSVGYNHEQNKLYTFGIPSNKENDDHLPPVHAVERNMNVLKALGHEIPAKRPLVPLNAEATARTFQLVPEPSDRHVRVILNISVGQADRMWPLAKWTELGKLLTSEYRNVVILAAPSDHAAAVEISKSIGRGSLAFCARTIHETIAMIRRGDLLVTCDSAPVHVASALDIPVVGIFHSILWNSYKFHPLSSLHRMVQPEVSISAITDIPIVSVFQSVNELLREYLGSQRSVL